MSGRNWAFLLGLFSVLLLLPLVGPLRALLTGNSDVWQHFANTLLLTYTRDTVILGLGVLSCTAILGVLPAWLLSRYELPWSAFLETVLLLPLAIPTYIAAYAYAGIFDFYGPIWQVGEVLGFSAEVLSRFRITNMVGLILVMSFALYPYVFLIMRNSFRFQVAAPLDVARSLGAGEVRQFLGLSLPLCRPALVGSLGIVLMEVLNEYGAVDYFGQNTLSTGIFRTWFGYYDLPATLRLGGLLMVIVFIILAFERVLSGRRRYDQQQKSELEKISCPPKRTAGLFLLALVPALLGFFIPLSQLLGWGLRELPHVQWGRLFQGTVNTLVLAVATGVIITCLSVVIAYARSLERSSFLRKLSDVSLLSHSVPGAVIALGMLGISQGLLQWGGSVVLSGSIFLLIYAYVVRFLAVSQRSISTIMAHQLRAQDEASRSLGIGSLQTLLRVHLPNLKVPILSALVLIFLEVIKELPLTIILRPFNFHTLAIRSYQLASSELVQKAAVPSLVLVAIAVVALLIFQRRR